MSKELVTVVDDQDRVLGIKPRSELKKSDIIRITSLWVENSQGQVLLAQRSFNKSIGPGQWGPAAAGTVESHETYRENIIKEAEEEIGLIGLNPIEVKKRVMLDHDAHYGRIVTFYKINLDKPLNDFKIDESEVAAIKWVDKNEVLIDVVNHPDKYVPSARIWQELFS